MKTIYTTILILFCATLSFAQNTVNYQYDNEGRIIHSDDGTKVQVYQYDNLGNRTSYTINSNATSTIDLTLNSISIPNTTVAQGQSYAVSCTAQNLGTTTVGTTILKVYLSPTATGTQTLLTTYNVPNINANSSENLSFTVSIPTTANLGNQFLVFFIDANTTITETDETNNKDNIAVTVTVPNLAELNLQNASLSANNVQAGSSIDITATVHNEGTVTANNFTVKSYLSNNATLEANDILLSNTTENITSLTANNNVAYNKTVLIPSNTIAGNYYILFVVDEANTVTEVDETNNVSAVSVIVTNTSTAPVADFMANSTNIAIDGTIQFTDQSTNDPTSWQWTFEGGTPSTSTQQNPQITYNIEGVYDVTLVVTNSNGDSTELKNDYITVGECQEAWTNLGIDGFSSGGTENLKIEIDNNGTPYVAFIDYGNSNMATVMKFDGTSWVLVGMAGFSGVSIGYLDLKIAPNNIPYIAYRNYTGTRKVTVKKFNGNSWVNVGSPNFTTDVIGNPSLAITSSNQPFVSFQEYYNSYKLRVMKFNGSSWIYAGNSILTFGDNTTSYPTYHSLEIDDNDNVYIAYQDISNSDRIAVKKYDNASNWNFVGGTAVSDGASQYPSLAFGAADIPYLAYKDEVNNNKTTVKWFTNGVWSLVGTAGFAPGGYTSYQKIVISDDNIPYVSMKYNNYGTSVMKFAGGNWMNVGDVDFPTSSIPNYQRLAISNDGLPYLVYRDGSNSNKVSVMKYDCDSSLGVVEELFSYKIKIYPNPASTIIHIEPSDNVIIENLKIYDITGKLLNSFKENPNSISVLDYTNGIYFIHIQTKEGKVVMKIVKSN